MPLRKQVSRRVGNQGCFKFKGELYSLRHVSGLKAGDILDIEKYVSPDSLIVNVKGAIERPRLVRMLPGGFSEFAEVIGEGETCL